MNNSLAIRYDLVLFEEADTIADAVELRNLEHRLNRVLSVNQNLIHLINTKIESLVSANSHLQSMRDHRDELRATLAAITASGISAESPVPDHETDSPDQIQALKTVWRKLAKVLHPDNGGDPELFDMARKAYEDEDLPTLSFMLETYYIDNFNRSQRRSLKRRNRIKPKIQHLRHRILSAESETALIKGSDLYQISNMDSHIGAGYLGLLFNHQIATLQQLIYQHRGQNGNSQNPT